MIVYSFFRTFPCRPPTWGIESEEDNKEHRGGTSSDISVDGLTIGARYRFVCEERIDEVVVSGKEKRTLVLLEFENLGESGNTQTGTEQYVTLL